MVRKNSDGNFERAIEMRSLDDLPSNEVLIRVLYSSLNYKDALSAIGNPGITRRFPHTPGIDAAGLIYGSKSEQFKIGQEVVVCARDLGLNSPGGFGQFISVPAEWVMLRPFGLTLEECMAIGTAGFTAALAVHEVLSHDKNDKNLPILVTGASGGVGAFTVAFLVSQGFTVTACTGKKVAQKFLCQLGATEVVDRDYLLDLPGSPLGKEIWGACIDTVGGNYLAAALKCLKTNGCMVLTGMTASSQYTGTVFPFILRGLKMSGINAQSASEEIRQEIWLWISSVWKREALKCIFRTIKLTDLSAEIDNIYRGEVLGRVVVDMS